ncbi:MAG TPA: penicillin-binding transpeptidase domain-containing protein, partial [Bacilli bacterium]
MKVSNTKIRQRMFIVVVIGTFVFLALLIRLGFIQLWIGAALSEKAENSWRRDIPFAPSRGEILDRNGVQLAYNISSPSVMAIPAQITDAKTTAEQLAKVLQMSEEKLYPLLVKRQSSVRIQPSGRKITQEKANQVRALNLPGIVVAEDNKRYYPFGTLASHVLGFTGIENQGLSGIERNYDELLQGMKGSISYLADAKGREMPNTSDRYEEPRDGLNLVLTIDKNIQSIMERELDQAMLQYQAEHIIAIAMDPNNGEILAMSGRPTYDPGHFAEYPSESYNRNLPIWMTYEPGSTFKIITLAAALEENKIDLLHDHFYDGGAIEVAGAR